MEESKVQMEETKMSYEELEKIAHNMYVRLQQADMSNMFKRLDYLFKVAKYKDAFSEDFYNKCISEIEMIMTVPEEQTDAE